MPLPVELGVVDRLHLSVFPSGDAGRDTLLLKSLAILEQKLTDVNRGVFRDAVEM